MMFPQVCITQKSSIGGVFSFLCCHLLTNLHWSLVSTLAFKLIHLESYLQTFILQNYSLFRLHPQVSHLVGFFFSFFFFGPNFCLDRLFGFSAQQASFLFFSFLFFSLALTFAQTALLGFQPNGLSFLFFFFFFFLAIFHLLIK